MSVIVRRLWVVLALRDFLKRGAWEYACRGWKIEKMKIIVNMYQVPSICQGFQIAQSVKNPPTMQETQFDSWVGKIC